MKKLFHVWLTLVLISLSISSVSAGGMKSLIKKGDKQFRKAYLDKALDYYNQALAIDSTNCYVNFQVGSIYYLLDSARIKSLPYFEKTIKYAPPSKDDTIIDAYYYMGNCYTLQKQYSKAITAYQKYLAHVANTDVNEEILKEVTHNITICQQAPTLMKKSSDSTGYLLDGRMHPVYVKNAGTKINSPYPEYAQVLLDRDSTLIFTSRRPASQSGKKDIFSNEYFEDIFISYKDSSGKWGLPSLFSNELHFKAGMRNLASVSISSDGKTLFIYNRGMMYESKRQGNKWSPAVRVENDVRKISDYMPSAFQSVDGTKLLLVSDKPGGWGGRDIYMSEKQKDGSWNVPENLGPTINTAYDEDAPFLMPDNKTLYFASTGHPGLGGYDIFKSVYENGQWSKPQNLGAPINSSADDIYFIYDTLMKKGYFSSSRVKEGYGGLDLYSFSFKCDNIENTVLKGKIVSTGNTQLNASVVLTDSKGKDYSTQSDQMGAYSLTLKPETKYSATIKAPGYKPFYTNIILPHQCDAYNLYQSINLSYINDSLSKHIGQKMVVKNGFAHTMLPGYKDAKSDASISSIMGYFNDSNSVWYNDSTITLNYTPAQIDSMNPGTMVTSKSIPKMPIVYFAFNKYNVEPKYNSMLDSIAAVVKSNAKYKIQIEGNTDTVGSAQYNQWLSIQRAGAVAHYLIGKGLRNNQIRTLGYGKRHLAVPEGASGLNRRDDIIIIE
jgi:outer membrane protein OmpA-like peptidoglycan-associated protein/tetratricopeptide (TPR) repeat protein